MRRDGFAPATIDVALMPLEAMYRRALNRGDVRHNPTRGIEKPAVRSAEQKFATPEEAAAMLATLDLADRALWATAFYAGLRLGELVALMPKDVDAATGVIRVRRGWDAVEGEVAPKGKQGTRNVPIPAELRDVLLEHLMTRPADCRVVESDRAVRRQMERAVNAWKAAGLPVLTLHEARHTYASLMIAAGVNAKALSTFMGHANIGITLDLYGHLFPGSEAQAADLLDTYLARSAGGATIAHEAVAQSPLRDRAAVLHLGRTRTGAPRVAMRARQAYGREALTVTATTSRRRAR
jgi:integrase